MENKRFLPAYCHERLADTSILQLFDGSGKDSIK